MTYLIYFFEEYIFKLSTEFIYLYFDEAYSAHLNIDLSNVSIGLGFLLNFFLYIILFYELRKINVQWKILIFNIVALSFLLVTLSLSIPLISRINFYFTPLLMIAYPLAFENMKVKLTKHIFIFFIMISTIYQYFYFFNSSTWIEKFYNYKTIFSI